MCSTGPHLELFRKLEFIIISIIIHFGFGTNNAAYSSIGQASVTQLFNVLHDIQTFESSTFNSNSCKNFHLNLFTLGDSFDRLFAEDEGFPLRPDATITFVIITNVLAINKQSSWNTTLVRPNELLINGNDAPKYNKTLSRLDSPFELHLVLSQSFNGLNLLSLPIMKNILSLFQASFDESKIFIMVELALTGKGEVNQLLRLNQDFVHFTEDKSYPGFTAKILFVQIYTTEVHFNWVCYLCLNKTQFEWRKWSGQVEQKGILSYSNFHGGSVSVTYYSYLMFTRDIMGCEKGLFILHSDCHRLHAILNILALRLNFTISSKMGPYFQPYEGPVRMEICFTCAFKVEKSLGSVSLRPFLYTTDVTFIYYCDNKPSFQAVTWTIFLEPIGLNLWILLGTCSTLLWVINRNFASGFTIYMMILEQQFNQRKWLRYPCLVLCISPLIVVTFWYSSIITTNIVAPTPPKIIDSFKEFFGLGYRLVTPNPKHTHAQ